MKPTRGRSDVVLPRLELETPRLRLRPACVEDAETVYASIRESIEPLSRWMDGAMRRLRARGQRRVDRVDALGVEAGGAYEFVVFERSGRHVGAVGLNQFNRENNCANLGYWVRRSSQRQGFAVEAVCRIARFAFEDAKFQRVEVVAAVDNVASRRVAERAGVML